MHPLQWLTRGMFSSCFYIVIGLLNMTVMNFLFLQLSNYCSMEGVLYCKPHLEQLFKETGTYTKHFQCEITPFPYKPFLSWSWLTILILVCLVFSAKKSPKPDGQVLDLSPTIAFKTFVICHVKTDVHFILLADKYSEQSCSLLLRHTRYMRSL